MRIRIKATPAREAHKLISWNAATWPGWLQDSDSVAWVMEWRGKGWLALGDIVYMQGSTSASGLGVMDNSDSKWEVVEGEE